MRTLLAALALGALLGSAAARAENKKEYDGFSALTVDQVADLVAKKEADVYDNNSKDRYAQSHVPGAKWVDFKDVKEGDLPTDKTRKLVFYCANTH